MYYKYFLKNVWKDYLLNLSYYQRVAVSVHTAQSELDVQALLRSDKWCFNKSTLYERHPATLGDSVCNSVTPSNSLPFFFVIWYATFISVYHERYATKVQNLLELRQN